LSKNLKKPTENHALNNFTDLHNKKHFISVQDLEKNTDQDEFFINLKK